MGGPIRATPDSTDILPHPRYYQFRLGREQPGRTQPVALLFVANPTIKAALGELGYHYFTSRQGQRHLEELLGVDIDDKIRGGRAREGGALATLKRRDHA